VLEFIARHGSIRIADDGIKLAPLAIDRHWLELETIANVAFFKTLLRGSQLTSAGEVFLTHRVDDVRRRGEPSRPRASFQAYLKSYSLVTRHSADR